MGPSTSERPWLNLQKTGGVGGGGPLTPRTHARTQGDHMSRARCLARATKKPRSFSYRWKIACATVAFIKRSSLCISQEALTTWKLELSWIIYWVFWRTSSLGTHSVWTTAPFYWRIFSMSGHTGSTSTRSNGKVWRVGGKQKQFDWSKAVVLISGAFPWETKIFFRTDGRTYAYTYHYESRRWKSKRYNVAQLRWILKAGSVVSLLW